MYQYSSILKHKFATGIAGANKIEGKITDFDEDFIELDNNQLISRKHIYRSMLK